MIKNIFTIIGLTENLTEQLLTVWNSSNKQEKRQSILYQNSIHDSVYLRDETRLSRLDIHWPQQSQNQRALL